MAIADRLVDAAIAQGPDSPAAALLRELVDEAERCARAEGDDGAPLSPDLAALIERAWLVS